MADVSEDATVAATRIVRKLTGGRWTWPPVRVREIYPAPMGEIHLLGRPVRQILTVTDVKTELELVAGEDYDVFHNVVLRFRPKCNRSVDVTYEYGCEPSTLVMSAIAAMAEELELSQLKSDACRLPERVTSVTRQGISYTVLDPQDFLDKGRTGIYEVDLAIKAAGGARRRSRVYSPEFPVPDRVETTILPLPAPFVGTLESRVLRGDTWRRRITLFGRLPNGLRGDPLDLDGVTFICQFRGPDGTVAAEASVDPTGEPGEVVLELLHTETELLEPEVYDFDLELTLADGDVVTALKGSTLTVYPDVSRDE